MSNCILTNQDLFKSFSPTAKHIASFDMKEGVEHNAYANLVKDCHNAGCKTKKEWYDYLRPFEEEILRAREEAGEKVKTSKGKWLFSKVSLKPDGTENKSYGSRKSVIGKALECGVPIVDSGGEALPKSVVEKSYKTPPKSKTPWEKAEAGLGAIINNWEALTPRQQGHILGKVFRAVKADKELDQNANI